MAVLRPTHGAAAKQKHGFQQEKLLNWGTKLFQKDFKFCIVDVTIFKTIQINLALQRYGSKFGRSNGKLLCEAPCGVVG